MRRERTAWQSWLRANMKLRFRPKALRPKKENVILAAGASLTFNAELSLLPSAPQAQPQTPANNAPNAPPRVYTLRPPTLRSARRVWREQSPADRFAFTKPWHGFTGQA